MVVIKDEVCKTWKEYFKELILKVTCLTVRWDYTVGLEGRKERSRYVGEEDIAEEEVGREIKLLENGKTMSINGVVHKMVKQLQSNKSP